MMRRGVLLETSVLMIQMPSVQAMPFPLASLRCSVVARVGVVLEAVEL